MPSLGGFVFIQCQVEVTRVSIQERIFLSGCFIIKIMIPFYS